MAGRNSTVLLKRGKLSLIVLDEGLIDTFVDNLSEQNLSEFSQLYDLDPRAELLKLSESDGFYYMVMAGSEPLALIGLTPDDEVTCQMWALFSKRMPKYWISFVRASPGLIAFLHDIYPNIEISIWQRNEFMHQWLNHLGFNAISTTEIKSGQAAGEVLTDFVRCIPPPLGVYAGARRPVLH